MCKTPVNDWEPYGYTPFEKAATSCIRVLQFTSPAGAPIECTLETIDLKNRTEQYDCLSYTWDDPLNRAALYTESTRNEEFEYIKSEATNGLLTQTILCDRHPIRVTQNLLDALHQLAARGYASPDRTLRSIDPPRRLWIDAVCINQCDDAEKFQQIRMMDRIYMQAQKVIIWLGKDAEDTDLEQGGLAIPVMEALSTALIPDPGASGPPVVLPPGTELDNPALCATLGIVYVHPESWVHYCMFLRRRWFTRVWVVQESFFASTREVWCGPHVVQWNTLVQGARVLAATNLGELLEDELGMLLGAPARDGVVFDRFKGRLNNQLLFDRIRRDEIKHMTLARLLYYTRYLNSTEKQDHIWGIYGIWKQSKIPREVLVDFLPEKERDVRATFSQATYLAIQEANTLDILGLVERSTEDDGLQLPSWVPDYSQVPRMRPLADAHLAGEKLPHPSWNAGGDLSWTPLPTLQRSFFTAPKLPVRGHEVDKILMRGPTYREVEAFGIEKLLGILDFATSRHRSMYPTHGSTCDTFWQTIIKGTFRYRASHRDDAHAFAAFVWERLYQLDDAAGEDSELQAVLERTQALVNTLSRRFAGQTCAIPTVAEMDTMLAISDGQRGRQEEERLDRERANMTENFRVSYSGRRVFLTVDGYFGLGPASILEGDWVWVLAGGKTAYILRHLPEKPAEEWEFVGEAYVFGIMNGEKVSNVSGCQDCEIYLT